MLVEKKHEQWKAITESDFVTLFIKTWFTYIAVLRELNPNVQVFAEDGKPRGDKPFLNAFKDSVMPIVQKQLPVDTVAQELFRMYPVCMRKVMDVFPQYFFQTFFRINESFSFDEKSIEKDVGGKTKERYEAHLHIVDRYRLKLYLGMSGQFRATSYNEEIKKEIDLRPVIESIIQKHRYHNLVINEVLFLHDFYDGVMKEISSILRHFTEEKLPKRGYNKTVSAKIEGACSRLYSTLHIKFDYNYKYPHEVTALDDPNAYSIAFQLPFNGFGRIAPDNVFVAHKGEYSQLLATKGVDWFASYVYALRNALFHEIISPLDEEWQVIFKSAYLILKPISDVCISVTTQISDFPKTKENSVFDYAVKHQDELFASLADSVELLDILKMSLDRWEIKRGLITLEGWFLVKFKLQMGTADDIAAGHGIIEEQDKGFDYVVTLNDDFSIAHDNEQNLNQVSIRLQQS